MRNIKYVASYNCRYTITYVAMPWEIAKYVYRYTHIYYICMLNFLLCPRDSLRGCLIQQLVAVTGNVPEGVREGARLRSAEVI